MTLARSPWEGEGYCDSPLCNEPLANPVPPLDQDSETSIKIISSQNTIDIYIFNILMVWFEVAYLQYHCNGVHSLIF